MLDRLDRGAQVGRDHGPAHGLCLDHHAAERFRLGRGMDDHVGQHQRRWHIMAFTHQTQPVGNAQRFGLADQAGGIAPSPLVRSHQHATHIAAGQARQRLDQHRLSLPTRQPPGQQHDRGPVGQPPIQCQPRHPMTRDRAWIEHRGVNAAWNDPDPRGVSAMLPVDQVSDEAAGHDHPLAVRHDRVVAALERQVLVVGAVIRGDEMRAGAPAGQARGPGRRARPGVDDCRALCTDKSLQPRCI